jgi:uncharacterized Zn finger protein (UPF0148 family)
MKTKEYNMDKKDLYRILGIDENNFLEFKDYLTDKDVKYYVKTGEELMKEKCPIDGTPLVYREVSQRFAGYCCPNCDNVFDDVSPGGLEKTYNEILEKNKDELVGLKERESELVKKIKRLEKVNINSNPKPIK